MAKAAVSAIRLWAYPATVIILWLFASAFALSTRHCSSLARRAPCSTAAAPAARLRRCLLRAPLQNGSQGAFHNGLEAVAGRVRLQHFSSVKPGSTGWPGT